MCVHFKRREIPFMPPPLKATPSFLISPIQNQKLALKPHGPQVCITVFSALLARFLVLKYNFVKYWL